MPPWTPAGWQHATISTSRDTTHPTHYTVEHYRRLASHWAQSPERLRLAVLDEGHRYSAQAEELAAGWVLEHLDDEGWPAMRGSTVVEPVASEPVVADPEGRGPEAEGRRPAKRTIRGPHRGAVHT